MGAGNDTVMTSLKETICNLLITKYLGSEKGESVYGSRILLLWKHSASISPQNGILWTPENDAGIGHDSRSDSRKGHAAHMKLNSFDDVTTNLGPILHSAW